MHPYASGEKGYFTLSISLLVNNNRPFLESKGLFVVITTIRRPKNLN